MSASKIERVRTEIADITMVEPENIGSNSRDFYWFSPILRQELDERVPDIYAIPETREELVRVVSACARHRVPVTVRGGGTGNYGQSVTLEGGVLISMTRLNRIVSSEKGVGRFEAGCRLLNIDRSLAPSGWELRLFPSTRKLATIGGFVAGGAGGIGSCTWGQLAETGAILGAQLITVEDQPRVIELRDRDVLKVQHAYGLNGILTEIEMPLAPRYPWAEQVLAFPDFTAAAQFAAAFTNSEAIVKKLVSVHEQRVLPYLEKLSPIVPAGQAFVIVLVNEPQVPVTLSLAAEYGGSSVFARNADLAEAAAFAGHGDLPPLYEFCWNHTTWNALKVDPSLTYLQIRLPQGQEAEMVAMLESDFVDELTLHLEFQRRHGKLMVSGLPILQFTTREALFGLMDRLESAGIQVSNPHTCKLTGAGWKQVDAPQAEFKRTGDPHQLLNPGKLAS
jgi:hypothetical protein